MPLVPASEYNPIFEPLSGKKIGFVALDGNVGDRLADLAAEKLLIHFNIDYYFVPEQQLTDGSAQKEYDELLIAGGGNMGTLYPICYETRMAALETGLPVTVLPQSFTNDQEDLSGYKQVYVREKASYDLVKVGGNVTLAPELALGLPDPYVMQPPMFEFGLFLRIDVESVFEDRKLSIVDPVFNNLTPARYLSFASMFSEIVTDRLHFAIAGLIMGRKVTLLPNAYHKNRSIYDTWLSKLGCHWKEDVSDIQYDVNAVKESLHRVQ